MAEEIIHGAITNASGQKSMWGQSADYDLIFTDRRMIAAMTADTGKAKTWGGDLGWAIAKSGSAKGREQYRNLHPEQILQRNPKNYSINYGDIQWIQLRKALGIATLRFKWSGGKGQFTIPGNGVENARSLLNTFLGDKIKK